jgi:hypothetical protein
MVSNTIGLKNKIIRHTHNPILLNIANSGLFLAYSIDPLKFLQTYQTLLHMGGVRRWGEGAWSQ